jgi:hypothetical protein
MRVRISCHDFGADAARQFAFYYVDRACRERDEVWSRFAFASARLLC